MTLTARLHRMSKSKICITTYVHHILNYAQCLIVERKQLKQDLDSTVLTISNVCLRKRKIAVFKRCK